MAAAMAACLRAAGEYAAQKQPAAAKMRQLIGHFLKKAIFCARIAFSACCVRKAAGL